MRRGTVRRMVQGHVRFRATTLHPLRERIRSFSAVVLSLSKDEGVYVELEKGCCSNGVAQSVRHAKLQAGDILFHAEGAEVRRCEWNLVHLANWHRDSIVYVKQKIYLV